MEIDFTNTSQICIFIILTTYIIMTIVKHFVTSRFKCNNVIPPLAMIVGCIISFIIMKVEPGYLGTNSLFEGLTIGIISGGCATSVNQVAKKLGVCINLSNLIDNSESQSKTTDTQEKIQNTVDLGRMSVVYNASGDPFYVDSTGHMYPITIINEGVKQQEFCNDAQMAASASTADNDPNVVITTTNQNPVKVTMRT